MDRFDFNKLSELLPLALSPIPNTEQRNMLMEELDKLFSDIDATMLESNKVYIESVTNTKQFESLMKNLGTIVTNINPENINFSNSPFNFSLKRYFNRLDNFGEELSKLSDEVDMLTKGFKADITTQNIELTALKNKITKLENLEIELKQVLDIFIENSSKVDVSNIELKSFIDSRIRSSIEGKHENLMKSTVITRQRIVSLDLSINNAKSIVETLKTAKSVTFELFGVLASLANEKFKQKIVLNCGAVYSGGNISLDLAKEMYNNAEKVFTK